MPGRSRGRPPPARPASDVVERRITGEDPLQLWAVIGEPALRRCVGGPDVLREQLEYLLKVIELPHVTVQVMPLDAHEELAAFFAAFMVEQS